MIGKRIILNNQQCRFAMRRAIVAIALLVGWQVACAQEAAPVTDDGSSNRLEIQTRILSMTEEVKQIYASIQMLSSSDNENFVKLPVLKTITERLKAADHALKTIDFRWATFYQAKNQFIAEDEDLIHDADFFQQIDQAVKDSLDKMVTRINQLEAFCRTELFMPSQSDSYQSLYEKAMQLSLVSKLAPQLEELKGKEALRFVEIQQHYDNAKEAAKQMPSLYKRMGVIEQQYVALKATSEKIQAAEYKPLIQRVKDYLLGFAAVAILLMFFNLLYSKIQSIMNMRDNMKKMKQMMGGGDQFYPTISLLPFLFLLLTSCDDQPEHLSLLNTMAKTDTVQTLDLSEPVFSDNHKTIVIEGQLHQSVGVLPITDPEQVRIDVSEHVHLLTASFGSLSPQLVKVENVASDQMKAMGGRMLVLVDLTLPQAQIDKERQAVKDMYNLFSQDNLYVSFIKGTTNSEAILVSDYILQNYFVRCDSTTKYLYRSILEGLNKISTDSSWVTGVKHKALVVMSDGVTYKNDMPIDPKHFEMEHRLISNVSTCPVFYADFSGNDASGQSDVDFLSDMGILSFDQDAVEDESTILSSYCTASRGLYQQHFDWFAIKEKLQKNLGVKFVDYRFTLDNPDNKVYRGRSHDLQIACYDVATDSLLVKGNRFYALGSAYAPVIVNPRSLATILFLGTMYALALILLVYVVMQFIVPFIRYKLFLKKHVMTYTGMKLSDNGMMTSETCYLCKAPFEEGDQVVMKCQHSMHLSCWDENQYQCPEYGRHCEHGRHYYNRHQLYDPQNASFYMRWIIVAILAGLLAWIANLSQVNTLLTFGLFTGFFLTLILSFMSVAQRNWLQRLADIFIRALIGGLGSLLIFKAEAELSELVKLDENSFIVDWIPWTLMGYWIALCVTWRTRIRIRHSLLIYATIAGLISTYLWTWLYEGSLLDYRITILINFIVYSIAMAVSIATAAPRSERYFLTVSGIIKQMDIALYKWFLANPSEHVSIGHSVDCNLQLSWDIQSAIAPHQAEIRLVNGVPRLYALESGVFVGSKPLSAGKSIRLYHGRRFSIGKTLFTYIEKDN